MLKAVIFEHFEPTEANKELVQKEIRHISEFLPEKGSLSAVLDLPHAHRFRALFRVHIKGKELVAEDIRENFSAALKGARDKIIRQLVDEKSKRRELWIERKKERKDYLRQEEIQMAGAEMEKVN